MSMVAGPLGNFISMKCILCGNKKFKIVSRKLRDTNDPKFCVTRCMTCELIQLHPAPTVEEDREFYDQGLHIKNIREPIGLKIQRAKQLRDTLRRADLTAPMLLKNQSVLDIGSGFGFFVEEMRKRSFKSVGVETSRFARNIATKVTKAEIMDIDIMDKKFDKKFDAITMFHVFEHIKNPVNFLQRIKELLNKNGRLIIEVPNVEDLLLNTNKAYANFIWQRAHYSYFSRDTLAKVFHQAGWRYCKFSFTQRYGLENMMNWMINNKPQLYTPSYTHEGNYKWLESFYKKTIISNGQADTLL